MRFWLFGKISWKTPIVYYMNTYSKTRKGKQWKFFPQGQKTFLTSPSLWWKKRQANVHRNAAKFFLQFHHKKEKKNFIPLSITKIEWKLFIHFSTQGQKKYNNLEKMVLVSTRYGKIGAAVSSVWQHLVFSIIMCAERVAQCTQCIGISCFTNHKKSSFWLGETDNKSEKNSLVFLTF